MKILDNAGNLETTATDEIQLVANDGTDPIGGTYYLNAVGGIATFNDVYIFNVNPHEVLSAADLTDDLASTTVSNPFPVLPVATSTSVASTPNPSTYGQTITFTATVTALPPPGGAFFNVPGGLVQFVEGGTVLGTNGLSAVAGDDQATLTLFDYGVGSHAVAAIYEGVPNYGDSNNFTDSTGTTTQVVNAVNTPPTLGNPGNQTNQEGDTVSLPLQGSDTDGDSLGYSATGLPAGLAVDPNTGVISGAITASPAQYSVTATVTDSYGYSASQSFTWTVTALNTPPTLLNPGSQTSNEGATVSLQLQGSDADGDTLSYSAFGLAASLAINPSTGLISGTLTASPGQYSVTATVDDGHGFSASQSFTWTVTDLPPVANNDSYTAVKNQTLTVSSANGVLANDSDPQGSVLTAMLVGGPAHGQLTLDPDGSLAYTPNKGFVGTDTFAYEAVDSFGAASKPANVLLVVAQQAPGTKPQFGNSGDKAAGGTLTWSIRAGDGGALGKQVVATFTFFPKDNKNTTITFIQIGSSTIGGKPLYPTDAAGKSLADYYKPYTAGLPRSVVFFSSSLCVDT